MVLEATMAKLCQMCATNEMQIFQQQLQKKATTKMPHTGMLFSVHCFFNLN